MKRLSDADALEGARAEQVGELQREANDLVWALSEAKATVSELRTADYSRLEVSLAEARALAEAEARERRAAADEAEALRSTVSMLQDDIRHRDSTLHDVERQRDEAAAQVQEMSAALQQAQGQQQWAVDTSELAAARNEAYQWRLEAEELRSQWSAAQAAAEAASQQLAQLQGHVEQLNEWAGQTAAAAEAVGAERDQAIAARDAAAVEAQQLRQLLDQARNDAPLSSAGASSTSSTTAQRVVELEQQVSSLAVELAAQQAAAATAASELASLQPLVRSYEERMQQYQEHVASVMGQLAVEQQAHAETAAALQALQGALGGAAVHDEQAHGAGSAVAGSAVAEHVSRSGDVVLPSGPSHTNTHDASASLGMDGDGAGADSAAVTGSGVDDVDCGDAWLTEDDIFGTDAGNAHDNEGQDDRQAADVDAAEMSASSLGKSTSGGRAAAIRRVMQSMQQQDEDGNAAAAPVSLASSRGYLKAKQSVAGLRERLTEQQQQVVEAAPAPPQQPAVDYQPLIDDLQQQVAALTQQLSDTQAQIASSTETVSDLSSRLSDSQQQYQTVVDAYNFASQQLSEAQQRADDASAAGSQAAEAIAARDTEIGRLQSLFDDAQQRVDALTGQCEAWQQESASLHAHIDETFAQLRHAEQSLQVANQVLDERTQEVADHKAAAAESQSQLQSVSTQLQVSRDEASLATGALSAARAECEALRSLLDAAMADLQASRVELQSSKAECEAVESAYQQAQEDQLAAVMRADAAEQELNAMKAQLADVQSTAAVAASVSSEEAASLTSHVEQLTAQLSSLRGELAIAVAGRDELQARAGALQAALDEAQQQLQRHAPDMLESAAAEAAAELPAPTSSLAAPPDAASIFTSHATDSDVAANPFGTAPAAGVTDARLAEQVDLLTAQVEAYQCQLLLAQEEVEAAVRDKEAAEGRLAATAAAGTATASNAAAPSDGVAASSPVSDAAPLWPADDVHQQHAAEHDACTARIADLQSQLLSTQQELAASQEYCASLQQRLADAESTAAASPAAAPEVPVTAADAASLSSLNLRVEDLQLQVAAITDQYNEAITESDGLRLLLAGATASSTGLQDQVTALTSDRDALTAQVTSLTAQVSQLTSERDCAQALVMNAEETESALREQVEVGSQQREEALAQLRGVQAELVAVQQQLVEADAAWQARMAVASASHASTLEESATKHAAELAAVKTECDARLATASTDADARVSSAAASTSRDREFASKLLETVRVERQAMRDRVGAVKAALLEERDAAMSQCRDAVRRALAMVDQARRDGYEAGRDDAEKAHREAVDAAEAAAALGALPPSVDTSVASTSSSLSSSAGGAGVGASSGAAVLAAAAGRLHAQMHGYSEDEVERRVNERIQLLQRAMESEAGESSLRVLQDAVSRAVDGVRSEAEARLKGERERRHKEREEAEARGRRRAERDASARSAAMEIQHNEAVEGARASAAAEVHRLRSEFQASLATIEDLRARVHAHATQWEASTATTASLQAKLGMATDEVASLRSDLASAQAREAMQQHTIVDLTSQVESITSHAQALQDQLVNAMEQIHAQGSSGGGGSDDHRQCMRQAEYLQQALSSCQLELQAAREEVAALTSSLHQAQEGLAQAAREAMTAAAGGGQTPSSRFGTSPTWSAPAAGPAAGLQWASEREALVATHAGEVQALQQQVQQAYDQAQQSQLESATTFDSLQQQVHSAQGNLAEAMAVHQQEIQALQQQHADELATSSSQLQSLQSQVADAHATIAAYEQQVAEARAEGRASGRAEAEAAWPARLAELQAAMQAQPAPLSSSSEQQQSALESHVSQLQDGVASLQQQLADLQTRYDTDIHAYASQLESSSQEMDGLRDQLGHALGRCEELTAAAAAAPQQVMPHPTTPATVEADAIAAAALAESGARILELQQLLADAEQACRDAQSSAAGQAEQVQLLSQRVTSLEGERDEANNTLLQLRSEISSYERQVAEMATSISQYEDRVTQLRARAGELEGTLTALRQQLGEQTASGAALSGRRTSVSSLTRPVTSAPLSPLAQLTSSELTQVATRVLRGVAEYQLPLCTCDDEAHRSMHPEEHGVQPAAGASADQAPTPLPLPLPVPVHGADVVRVLMSELAEQEAEILLLRSSIGNEGEGYTDRLLRTMSASSMQRRGSGVGTGGDASAGMVDTSRSEGALQRSVAASQLGSALFGQQGGRRRASTGGSSAVTASSLHANHISGVLASMSRRGSHVSATGGVTGEAQQQLYRPDQQQFWAQHQQHQQQQVGGAVAANPLSESDIFGRPDGEASFIGQGVLRSGANADGDGNGVTSNELFEAALQERYTRSLSESDDGGGSTARGHTAHTLGRPQRHAGHGSGNNYVLGSVDASFAIETAVESAVDSMVDRAVADTVSYLVNVVETAGKRARQLDEQRDRARSLTRSRAASRASSTGSHSVRSGSGIETPLVPSQLQQPYDHSTTSPQSSPDQTVGSGYQQQQQQHQQQSSCPAGGSFDPDALGSALLQESMEQLQTDIELDRGLSDGLQVAANSAAEAVAAAEATIASMALQAASTEASPTAAPAAAPLLSRDAVEQHESQWVNDLADAVAGCTNGSLLPSHALTSLYHRWLDYQAAWLTADPSRYGVGEEEVVTWYGSMRTWCEGTAESMRGIEGRLEEARQRADAHPDSEEAAQEYNALSNQLASEVEVLSSAFEEEAGQWFGREYSHLQEREQQQQYQQHGASEPAGQVHYAGSVSAPATPPSVLQGSDIGAASSSASSHSLDDTIGGMDVDGWAAEAAAVEADRQRAAGHPSSSASSARSHREVHGAAAVLEQVAAAEEAVRAVAVNGVDGNQEQQQPIDSSAASDASPASVADLEAALLAWDQRWEEVSQWLQGEYGRLLPELQSAGNDAGIAELDAWFNDQVGKYRLETEEGKAPIMRQLEVLQAATAAGQPQVDDAGAGAGFVLPTISTGSEDNHHQQHHHSQQALPSASAIDTAPIIPDPHPQAAAHPPPPVSEWPSRRAYMAFLDYRSSNLAEQEGWDEGQRQAWLKRQYDAWVAGEGASVPEQEPDRHSVASSRPVTPAAASTMAPLQPAQQQRRARSGSRASTASISSVSSRLSAGVGPSAAGAGGNSSRSRRGSVSARRSSVGGQSVESGQPAPHPPAEAAAAPPPMFVAFGRPSAAATSPTSAGPPVSVTVPTTPSALGPGGVSFGRSSQVGGLGASTGKKTKPRYAAVTAQEMKAIEQKAVDAARARDQGDAAAGGGKQGLLGSFVGGLFGRSSKAGSSKPVDAKQAALEQAMGLLKPTDALDGTKPPPLLPPGGPEVPADAAPPLAAISARPPPPASLGATPPMPSPVPSSAATGSHAGAGSSVGGGNRRGSLGTTTPFAVFTPTPAVAPAAPVPAGDEHATQPPFGAGRDGRHHAPASAAGSIHGDAHGAYGDETDMSIDQSAGETDNDYDDDGSSVASSSIGGGGNGGGGGLQMSPEQWASLTPAEQAQYIAWIETAYAQGAASAQ